MLFEQYNDSELSSLLGSVVELDVRYIPIPNHCDVVISNKLAPDNLTLTAFCFPFLENGSVILANNRRRGIEVPGGHREWLNTGTIHERLEMTAIREAIEETGNVVVDICPVGFMRSYSTGQKPDNYKYPFPYSCQQFFTGFAQPLGDYIENDECKTPIIVEPLEVHKYLTGRTFRLYLEAFNLLFK
jgi:8-oxo-dGTP diphosphatase